MVNPDARVECKTDRWHERGLGSCKHCRDNNFLCLRPLDDLEDKQEEFLEAKDNFLALKNRSPKKRRTEKREALQRAAYQYWEAIQTHFDLSHPDQFFELPPLELDPEDLRETAKQYREWERAQLALSEAGGQGSEDEMAVGPQEVATEQETAKETQEQRPQKEECAEAQESSRSAYADDTSQEQKQPPQQLKAPEVSMSMSMPISKLQEYLRILGPFAEQFKIGINITVTGDQNPPAPTSTPALLPPPSKSPSPSIPMAQQTSPSPPPSPETTPSTRRRSLRKRAGIEVEEGKRDGETRAASEIPPKKRRTLRR
ncbi:hypothetical protein BDY21DRAFT_349643 [Lineolata rhizophorae]|uniref:Uncharacterized protein n=1 Tax=Lineolata rhizophorae TaxID=578093 RepID=A0A6A6NVF3_9PEZI|nr:hypothetical protein BDY21DRAFT_349643 [Lineolata rhizophorae]